MTDTIRVGSVVESRFGVARVLRIERTERDREKDGQPVSEVTLGVDHFVLDLDNQHFVYSSQVTRVVSTETAEIIDIRRNR